MITETVTSQPEQHIPAATEIYRPLKILIIDHRGSGSDTLVWAIESLGDSVQICHYIDYVVDQARQYMPDVIILDLPTVGADTPRLCRALHQIKGVSCAKIIRQGTSSAASAMGMMWRPSTTFTFENRST
jgi:PleD family two-component response regulator